MRLAHASIHGLGAWRYTTLYGAADRLFIVLLVCFWSDFQNVIVHYRNASLRLVGRQCLWVLRGYKFIELNRVDIAPILDCKSNSFSAIFIMWAFFYASPFTRQVTESCQCSIQPCWNNQHIWYNSCKSKRAAATCARGTVATVIASCKEVWNHLLLLILQEKANNCTVIYFWLRKLPFPGRCGSINYCLCCCFFTASQPHNLCYFLVAKHIPYLSNQNRYLITSSQLHWHRN